MSEPSQRDSNAAAGPAALRVEGIAKSYGVVKALRPTSLALAAGEVHALVGENGSGKSTMVGIVSGTVIPDAGAVEIGGELCRSHTPWESQRHGALTVFQDGSVIPELSVAQNLYLGTPISHRPGYREVNGWAAERLGEFGLERIDPRLRAGKLSAGERQLLEIVRAIMAEPGAMLLDEATSALDAGGVDVALELMRGAAERGCAVLFVTHRLSEVFRVADRISVLRDGEYRGTWERGKIDQEGLVEQMAGRSVNVEFPARATAAEIGEPIVRAERLRGDGYGPIDLELRRGEIVGVAGADGNGQLDLLGGLAAIGDPDGALEVDGVGVGTFGQAVEAGVSYLSSDRRDESLFPTLAIRENLVVSVLGELARGGVITRPRENAAVAGAIERFGVRLGSPEDPMTSLSGGNQQKVALGKVLATEPRVLLCDEPTQGVDVRSRMEIYRMLRETAREGLAVVVVSSDAAELAGLCDRVVVLSRGEAVAELSADEASEDSIVHAFAGHESGPEEAAEAGPAAAGPRPLQRARGFLERHEDFARLSLLAAILVLLGAYTQSQTSNFLSAASLYNVLLLALPLAAVAAAEYVVMFIGGIDISVAGTMAVTVVLLSFWVQSGSALTALALALAIAIGVGLLIGFANASLIERLRISPVIATIATLGILQGVGLMLRPTADGIIALDLTSLLTAKLGFLPWPLVVIAVLFVAADWLMRSTGIGLRLRAVGLNSDFAFRLGVNAPRLRQLGYVLCAVLAAIAGVILAGQVGIGDSTVGNQYILLAIAAPIVGGASLLGGRGSFTGCLLGSVLLALGLTLPTTLSLGEGWDYFFTGALTLIALAIYTQGVWSSVTLALRTLRRRVFAAPRRRPRPADSA